MADHEEYQRQPQERRAALEALRDEYAVVLDVEEELKELVDLSDEEFRRRYTRIAYYYRRDPLWRYRRRGVTT